MRLSATSDSGVTIADLRRHRARLELRPVKRITHVWPGAFRWEPDGRAIVYENNAGVWVANARRAQPPRRFPVPAYVYTSLTWSPDMRWLAFSLSREPPIEVANADGRQRHSITRKICRILDEIAWAPR
ncbi:MAG: hypothetical protein E6G26_10435 [Actinobacteria bacterium]|nr:MAG: hypothetical protein E6G26_10435 [Actinomycetota bacterium]